MQALCLRESEDKQICEVCMNRAREFDEFSGRGLSRFVRFLEKIAGGRCDLGEVRPIGEGEDVVRVMSMHKSKGLEFPVGFLG